ncbi:MAG: hypothetical protein WBZ45_10735, partial [Acidimicrobiia bacterium]
MAVALVLGYVLAACAGPVPATTTAEIAPEDIVTITTKPGAVTTVTTTSPNTNPTTITSGEEAKVVSVTDGDTIRVDYEGGNNVAVRLIGINSPELGEC